MQLHACQLASHNLHSDPATEADPLATMYRDHHGPGDVHAKEHIGTASSVDVIVLAEVYSFVVALSLNRPCHTTVPNHNTDCSSRLMHCDEPCTEV